MKPRQREHGSSLPAKAARRVGDTVPPPGSRIVLVARDRIYSRVLEDAVLSEDNQSEVSSYYRAESGMKALRTQSADMAVLDVDMPDMDGLDYIPEIIQFGLARRTIIFSSRRDERALIELSVLNWDAWIDLAKADSEELSVAFAQIQLGRRFVSQSLRDARIALIHRADKVLTSREALVLSILGEGLDNREAGARLAVSSDTIRTQRTSIMRKLGVHHVGQLILRAQTLAGC